MKLWIVGNKGLLASHLYKKCRTLGIEAVSTSRGELDIARADLMDFVEKQRPSHIVNCAAFTHVDRAEEQREEAFLVNALGPERIGKAARSVGAKVIHISTDYVFSGDKKSPYLEVDPPDPKGVYGQTKWEGERRLLEMMPEACVIRTSWVYGKGGENFFSRCLGFLQQNRELAVVDDQMSRVTYVSDLVEAILGLIEAQGIFHFANEGVVSRFAVAQELRRMALLCKMNVSDSIRPILLQEVQAAAPRPLYSALDTGKWEHWSGQKPRSWQETFQEYIHEYS